MITPMADRYAPGARVRTSRLDPPHHTRLPRYVRGAVGTVVESQGAHPLPDDRSRGIPTEPSPVYTVRFEAEDLFPDGDHAVTVDIWETHLMPADDDATEAGEGNRER